MSKRITEDYIRSVFKRIRKQLDLFDETQEDLLEMKKSIRQIIDETNKLVAENY